MTAFCRCIHTGFLALAAAALVACGGSAAPPIDSLVTAGWLNEHLQEDDLVILDATVMVEMGEDGKVRTASGRDNFVAGHIPGAQFADLIDDLSDRDSPFRYAVPAPEAFAAAMQRLGVDDDSRVVIYSTNSPSWAARVWWMLRWIGFDNAALLNGGLKAWTDAGYSLSTETIEPAPGSLTVRLRPELIVDADTVHAAIGNESINIIDALPADHYNGVYSMYERPGHIPGASNVPVWSLTDDADQFRTEQELATFFDGDLEGRAITYCGGGIAASTNAFIMTRLGYKDVAVYTNSLQEWTADPNNPMESGGAATNE